jgi:hypothetical protein
MACHDQPTENKQVEFRPMKWARGRGLALKPLVGRLGDGGERARQGARGKRPVETSSNDNANSTPAESWAVHRQDDNGNQFVVETGLRRAEAEQLVAIYEGRGHKQVYWAQAEKR